MHGHSAILAIMKHTSLALFCVLSLLIIGIAALFYLISPVSESSERVSITVNPGDTIYEISAMLYDNNLIRHPLVGRIFGNALFKNIPMKAGEYSISKNENPHSIFKKFAVGVPRQEVRLVIPEGWSVKDIAAYLEEKELFSPQAFIEELQDDWSAGYPFLAGIETQQNLEGYLFPDTYRVYKNATPQDVIKKMLDNFDMKFDNELRRRAGEMGISVRAAVILASIIEREVIGDEDRARVADIFYRRMKLGMPLQADSTVNYITGKKSPQASLDDTLISSTYNTYSVRGLPPGPISNPGMSSLRAALYPLANDYLFFLTTPERKTIFSKTFAEHIKNKQRYLR